MYFNLSKIFKYSIPDCIFSLISGNVRFKENFINSSFSSVTIISEGINKDCLFVLIDVFLNSLFCFSVSLSDIVSGSIELALILCVFFTDGEFVSDSSFTKYLLKKIKNNSE